MNTFIKKGIIGREHGFLIPVTIEDPDFKAVLDEYSETFRINLYCGSEWIGEINMNNFREVHNDLFTPCVYDIKGNYTGTNVWGHVRNHYLWEKGRIYGSNSLHLVKDVHSLAKLDWYFSMLEPIN
jgi:hypothetical protein